MHGESYETSNKTRRAKLIGRFTLKSLSKCVLTTTNATFTDSKNSQLKLELFIVSQLNFLNLPH